MLYKRGTFTANASQSAAITHKLAPLMIIAGAGTGKTTTLLHRIYYLIEHYNLNPENVLTITYTEKAADELKTRIVNNIGDVANAMTISTFHAFCNAIVKESQPPTNFAPILMDEGDAIYLFLKNFDKLGSFESRSFVVDPLKSITQSFIPFINRLRDELIDPAKQVNPDIDDDIFTKETVAQLSDLKRIYPLFQKWKKEQNFVDFGDMILDCYNLLKSNESILKQVQNQYKYLIIDEFQDNNFALNEIVNRIFGSSGQLTVVGDEDQVVYSFRGASKYNISAFRNKFKNHNNYAEITLNENFRSVQQILDVANNSISNAINREQKQLTARDNKSGEKPHLFNLEGIEQVVMMSETGATAFQPFDGKVLWEYKSEGARIVQPSLCENGDLLISAGGATGIGRISVTNESGKWTIQERWTSIRLRPNFNDFVIHKGHAYGFDGPGLACIELEEGKRKWKGGRFGGQILLLADQDLTDLANFENNSLNDVPDSIFTTLKKQAFLQRINPLSIQHLWMLLRL